MSEILTGKSENNIPSSESPLPLEGIRVVEMTHMVMGPAVGLVLADLGADVVKVEPLDGDKTRRLVGSGAGYFPMYNRNKRSLGIDLKSEKGRRLVQTLVRRADVLVENFRPGAVDKLGFSYEELSEDNPGLIYCSCKGFMRGPYEHRTALDEVAQMMGGLAYMTGPPDRPLRAGASVIDVLGGVFGAIGILAALEQRHRTGHGCEVKSSLFESTAFLVGQHIAQYAVTGKPAPPMPVRISAWAIYDVFATRDKQHVFVGVVTDTQWRKFCDAFELHDLAADDSLAANSDRVAQREHLLPRIRELFAGCDKAALMERLEAIGLPFAPISRPEDLLEDPHMNAMERLLELTLPNGTPTRLPALPLNMNGHGFGVRKDLPREGQHSREILDEIGYTEEQIDALAADGILRIGE